MKSWHGLQQACAAPKAGWKTGSESKWSNRAKENIKRETRWPRGVTCSALLLIQEVQIAQSHLPKDPICATLQMLQLLQSSSSAEQRKRVAGGKRDSKAQEGETLPMDGAEKMIRGGGRENKVVCSGI